MNKVLIKMIILVVLLVLFLFLFFKLPKSTYKKVEIIEKYYTPHSNGKAKGITTNKNVPTYTIPNGQEACLMEFSNGQILEMDCIQYLNYKVGEKVKIKYDKHQLLDIRRK
ncbi:hypothetical protein [Heyndrickxia oleronia]|jgi:Ca2+/Na+ antiporter|uniref:hypothetical protein n=1 Tax=Heyndrickxia oleronia TaxID=38875 RepID=UPI00090391B5|nr:hypothetical protein [Heyndrickxia oleronia]OJH18801.1 hypothetical protein BLX88_11435 [Bacillus obstructivus]MCI1590970.1 hypothetical protein [Heyndrickxia oleronia]MCI1614474.1 hypothetical protein [Heyndrickxia oleronia]MCI1743427.1 hypothetical protein [Heyndrickxia oleronia]MCI1762299.1 hypothetical protein [Heyndrickxia oleronia]